MWLKDVVHPMAVCAASEVEEGIGARRDGATDGSVIWAGSQEVVNSVGTEAAGWAGVAAGAVGGIVGMGVFDEAIAPKPEKHFEAAAMVDRLGLGQKAAFVTLV